MTLFDMILGAHKKTGTARFSVSTGGTVGTLIDLSVASTGATPLAADAYLGGTIFVTQSTGSASAIAGQWSQISAFAPGTGTWTLSSNLASSGPNPTYYGYVTPEFSLSLSIELANDALRSLGPNVFVDRATVSSANQNVYNLSSAFKYTPPLQIDVMGKVGSSTDDPDWTTVEGWEYQPSTAGAVGSIIFPRQLPSGRDIRIWYQGHHHRVSDSTHVIDERIHPELAVLCLVDKMYEYRNSISRGAIEFDQARWRDAKEQLALAKATWPLPKRRRKPKILVVGPHVRRHEHPLPPPYGP